MRTQKQIKKRISECKREIKTFESFLNKSTKKADKELKEMIRDYNYEICVLKWVLTSENLPF